MKNLTVLLSAPLLFLSLLFIISQAKVRNKYADKFKRSLQKTIASLGRELPPMKVEMRQRHKREAIEENNKEIGDAFKVEIKFLEKWNPLMSDSESSASRLFRGNVLDAILEQLNGDKRFIDSQVLGLKNTPGGILVPIGFHFRKSELNPISHMKFIISRGRLSSLKVDKNYFKILQSKGQIKVPFQTSLLPQSVPPTQTQSLDHFQQFPPPQEQVTTPVNQNVVQDPSKNLPQNLQPQSVSQTHFQDQIQSQTQEKPPVLINTEDVTQAHAQPQNLQQTQPQNQPQILPQTQSQDQTQSHTQEQPPDLTNTQSDAQTQPQPQLPHGPQTGSNQIEDGANPSAATSSSHSMMNAQENSEVPTVSNDMSIALGAEAQSSSFSPHGKKEEDIFFKVNQNWYPFLSNHNSLEYKMLTGNLEKGLKSVIAGDKSIVDIEVKNLIKAEEGLTKVQLSVKFLAKNGDPADKFKSIVNTGDIAGIPVDRNFFEKTEDDKAAPSNPFGSNENAPQIQTQSHINDDGKAFLSRVTASGAKQENPSVPWQENVPNILNS